MTFPLCPPGIAPALGDSIIAEEYRGDFAAARAAAEEALGRARAGGDAAALADALLARGAVHLLQHEGRAALACFEESGRAAGDDADCALLAHVYPLVAQQQHFTVAPGWIASATLETGRRWDAGATLAAAEPVRLALRGRAADPGQLLHADLVNDLLFLLPMARSILAGREILSPDQQQAMAARLAGAALGFRERADAAGAATLAASADLAAADLCWRGGDRGTAGPLLQRAQAAFEAGGDPAGAAACWLRLGDWLSAPRGSAATWGLRMQDGDWSHALSVITERAEFPRGDARPAEAREAYARAGELYAAAGAPRGGAAVSLRLGWLDVLGGDHSAALARCVEAERAFTAAGDTAGAMLARAHAAMAVVGAGRGEDHQIAREIGAWGAGEGGFGFATGLGLFFARAGRRWLAHEGDAERALACFRLAETLFDALRDGDGAAQAMADRGTTFAAVRDASAAAVAFEAAHAHFRAVAEARPEYATALWEKSVLVVDALWSLALEAQDPAALERRTAALAALHAAPPAAGGPGLFTPAFADTLHGLIASRMDVAAALVPFLRALRAREAGDPAEVERQAQAALVAARGAAPERRDFLEAQVHRLRRSPADAEAAFERFLSAGGAAAGQLGDVARRLGERFGEVGGAVAEDRPAQSHQFAATFFCGIGRWRRALDHLRAVEAERGEKWWLREPEPWDALRCYAEAHEGLGELDLALERFEQAMNALEARWVLLGRDESRVAMTNGTGPRHLYFGALRAALRALQAAPAEERQARAARVFEISERGRARALLELLAEGGEAGREVREGAARLALWRGLLAREQAGDAPDPGRVAELARRIAEEERRLRDAGAAAGGFLRGSPLTLAATAARLPEGTALLHHAFLGDHMLCWAVTRDGMVEWDVRDGDARALGHQVRTFHRACAVRGADGGAGARLSAALLEPLAGVVRTHAALVVVPYGPAHLLPFHALPWEGAPLGATRTVSYLPSAGVLPFLGRGALGSTRRVLAVGNPGGMTYQPPLGGAPVALRPLPGAGVEAAFVAGLFPEGRALLGEEATEAAVRAEIGAWPVLHLATHGYLSDESPMLSALLLAGGGDLRVHELMGMRLDAELVVLSACETGRGEGSGGDEVLGLTRALLAAGARAVVVSLWPVDDESTSLLMGELYRRLREGLPAADALRDAQAYLRALDDAGRAREIARMSAALAGRSAPGPLLAGLREAASRHLLPADAADAPKAAGYDHPYHWAPFILVSAP